MYAYTIHYKWIDGKKAQLLSPVTFHSDIKGYTGRLKFCELLKDGRLICYSGFEWDFGTYAIDDHAMVHASLFHDPICTMTNRGILPWSVRAKCDAFFRKTLIKAGCSKIVAWWRWTGVRLNSTTIARWKREKPA